VQDLKNVSREFCGSKINGVNMNYISKIHEKEYKIKLLKKEGNQVIAEIDGELIPIQLIEKNGSHIFSAIVGNSSYELEIRRNDNSYLLFYDGISLESLVEDERMARLKKSMGQSGSQVQEKEIKAPMPGLVITIEVEPGQKVKKSDGMLIIEAMKMENEIKAPFDAVIKEIKVKEKIAVEKNQVLMILE
jgi:acetyl/propionyl-CoA carboxylase alpha subunit